VTENILELFNSCQNADEVRRWINANINRLHIYDEWPRGCGALGILTKPMRDCKFSSELQKDMKLLDDGWSTGTIPVL